MKKNTFAFVYYPIRMLSILRTIIFTFKKYIEDNFSDNTSISFKK